MDTLPLEIFARILKNLSCLELSTVACVCKLWQHVIQCDPWLRTICFKRPSPIFFDEGVEPGPCKKNRDSRIRFHPAMGRIVYQLGDPLSTVYITANDIRGCHTPLIDLPLQDDFATIPATNVMNIRIFQKERPRRITRGLLGLAVSISNPAGIRLRDIFSSIVTESTECCDLVSYASGGRTCNKWLPPFHTFHKKAQILGQWKSYAGVESIAFKDATVEVRLCTTT